MSLYALLVFVVILALLCIVWKYLSPIFGHPWDKIGWAIIGAFAVLYLAKMLILSGPVLL